MSNDASQQIVLLVLYYFWILMHRITGGNISLKEFYQPTKLVIISPSVKTFWDIAKLTWIFQCLEWNSVAFQSIFMVFSWLWKHTSFLKKRIEFFLNRRNKNSKLKLVSDWSKDYNCIYLTTKRSSICKWSNTKRSIVENLWIQIFDIINIAASVSIIWAIIVSVINSQYKKWIIFW